MCTRYRPKLHIKEAIRKEKSILGHPVGSPYRVGIFYRCGKCDTCRAIKINDWTVRNYYASLSYSESYFLTLTYTERKNPKVLRYNDVTRFINSLKKWFKFDYFLVGEYGGENHRPHYHIIIYTNHVLSIDSVHDYKKYLFLNSRLLKIWKNGLITFQLLDNIPSSVLYLTCYTLSTLNYISPELTLVDKKYVEYNGRLISLQQISPKVLSSKALGYSNFATSSNINYHIRNGFFLTTRSGKEVKFRIPISWIKKQISSGNRVALEVYLKNQTLDYSETFIKKQISFYQKAKKLRKYHDKML